MLTIPIYDTILLPEVTFYFKKEVIEGWKTDELEVGGHLVFALLRNDIDIRDTTMEDIYPIGVTARVESIDQDGNVKVRTKERVNILEFTREKSGLIDSEIEPRPEIADMDENDKKTRFEELKSSFLKFVSNYQWGLWARGFILQWKNINELACSMTGYFGLTWEEKYEIVEVDSEKERFDLIERGSYEFMELANVAEGAELEQQARNESIYREDAIKKQIEILQRELDEMHPENISDVRRFDMLISESGMNETAEREARKVLNRMKQEGQDGHEYGMLYDYLDFVTTLSWKPEEFKPIDLDYAETVLDKDHYGLKKVKQRIIQQLAIMALNKKQSGSILLFVGAPGTGKTSIGQSIAEALGREYVRISLGGVRDEAEIRGHRRTYIGAMPGRIMEGMKRSGVSNPVMVLDEVDKLVRDYGGDPSSALLEVLDPEQNATFTDHYMNVPYDLSDVLFICTANTLETIPEPLLNRMEVIPFNGYTPIEKFQIARRHLMPKALSKVGITSDDIEVTDEAIRAIISDYTREAGVRGLKKRLETLCRTAAVKIVERKDAAEDTAGDTGKLVVRAEDLREFLDMHPLHEQHVEKEADPGVVTGLAWTSVGGTILYIETLMNSGSGKMTITGQLGDVMKESAQIAVSLVKSLFPEKAEKFAKNDLHIHVPDGATPKDGPSAGVTLTTALASLVTGNPVDPRIAMTGEVSLQGKVKPIGGLPEKLMAAQRAGVKKVFIPKENVEDLDDVAKEVRDQLQIIPVTHVTEILQQTGVMELSRIPSAV